MGVVAYAFDFWLIFFYLPNLAAEKSSAMVRSRSLRSERDSGERRRSISFATLKTDMFADLQSAEVMSDFVAHCFNELSPENVLALLEIADWKKHANSGKPRQGPAQP